MLDDGDFVGQSDWDLYLIHGTLGIFIYALITESTRINFGYLKLKPGIGDDNFGRRERKYDTLQN